MCCECSKILSYLVTRNSGYLRRGRVPAGDAGQDSESDGASVVWESGSEHDVAEGPAAAGQARGGQMGQTSYGTRTKTLTGQRMTYSAVHPCP